VCVCHALVVGVSLHIGVVCGLLVDLSLVVRSVSLGSLRLLGAVRPEVL
jgi:hypothetical protein